MNLKNYFACTFPGHEFDLQKPAFIFSIHSNILKKSNVTIWKRERETALSYRFFLNYFGD